MSTRALETKRPAPPGTAYTLYMLLLLLGAYTLSYADRQMFAVLIPSIGREFALSNTTLGLIAGPGFVIPHVLFTMPLAGLADRWSRRGVLGAAILFWSIASAACGLAGAAWQLTLARIGVGIGEAGGTAPAQAIASGLFPRRRSAAMGVLSSGVYFGILLGLAGGAAIADVWGWRAAFIALALPGAPLAILIWFTGPRREIGTAAGSTISGRAAIARCLRIRSLLLFALGMGIFNIFGYAAAIWLPSFFVASHHMTMTQAGLWLGVGTAAGGIFGSFASGAIVEALAPRDPRWQLRVPALGLLLSFPLLMVMFLLPGGAAVTIAGHAVPLVAPISLVSAFLNSLWMGPSFAAMTRVVPVGLRAQAIGLVTVAINVIGTLLGPPIAGAVSDLLALRFGPDSLRYSLLAMSSLMLVGGLLIWRAAEWYRSDMIAE